MRLALLINTIRYLKPTQIYHQISNRLKRPMLKNIACEQHNRLSFVKWLAKPECIDKDGNKLKFINCSDEFCNWGNRANGMLWAYNLNYMDWLLQNGMEFITGAVWIDRFIDEINTNNVGLDPYPTALRGVNWIKFILTHYDEIDSRQMSRWNNSLYSQYTLLYRQLEFHLLGNHLIEDVFSLFIAALYFNDIKFYKRSVNILRRQLKEQILNDGAHYEQSPMYHCILLDRVLDCYNFSVNNIIFDSQEDINKELHDAATIMSGHLEAIIYSDGSIPLINDSAYGIAPQPEELFAYARRLNLKLKPIALSDSGYRRFNIGRLETIIDIGDMTASYQPGHSHADTLSYEARFDGKPFIVDTGISTYEKNQRRQYERSTAAHNTVSINGKDSSEVWGGFRVGKRAHVNLIEESDHEIIATHDGFGQNLYHTRIYRIQQNFEIIDEIPEGNIGISYIHFAPSVKIEVSGVSEIRTDYVNISVAGAIRVEIEDGFVSTEYNRLLPAKTAKIYFKNKLKYTLKCDEDTVSNG